ncbi:hypothetical protein GIB67_019733 [Kingdonia uniflora]|uniref:Major facilitator superfamily (MFS) profile domain-containing protein n=1 Tax=Kingdonia uniflora TaxID=39325 RepID=A0A7J7MK11_9MAGN|nr:hypothetical protein GIB67_019733 [Kingdonia uniflora]
MDVYFTLLIRCFLLNLLFVALPGLLIAAVIMDRLGRKVSMSTMFFLSYIFLLPLVIYQPESLTTGLLLGARICITEAFAVVFLYAPDQGILNLG